MEEFIKFGVWRFDFFDVAKDMARKWGNVKFVVSKAACLAEISLVEVDEDVGVKKHFCHIYSLCTRGRLSPSLCRWFGEFWVDVW